MITNLIKWLTRPPGDKRFGKGWLIDPPDDRAYRVEEIMSTFKAVNWREKTPDEWRRFPPIRNQGGAGACVGYTVQLLLGIENFLEEGKFVMLSPRMIYARGYVPPDGGMYYASGLQIGTDIGSAPEVLMPSELKDEQYMRQLADEKESDRIVGKTYRGGSFVYLPLNFDAIAGILATGKAIALGTRFNSGQWSSGEVKLTANGQYGHAITATDYTLWKGQKSIVFQNSWGENWGFKGLGVITEDQNKGGLVLACYYTDLQNKPSTGPKPKLRILAPLLKVGDKGSEVTKLQTVLQYLGFFPAGQECTGYYGGITRQAVKDYETKNSLPADGAADADVIRRLNEFFK